MVLCEWRWLNIYVKMYRITAINNEPDTDEEDCSKVTQEAEVSVFVTITSINKNFQYANHTINIKW